MSDVYNLRHYFIVFHPGAGGNFLAGLTDKLMSNNLSKLDISSTGSFHVISNTTSNKVNLPRTTFVRPLSLAHNRLAKISDVQQQFTQLDIKKPIISCTHDFTNIPIYRHLFPNAKILVVTQESLAEKLTITILQQLKNILDPNVISTISKNRRNVALDRWKEYAEYKITKLFDDKELAKTIVDDRFNPDYQDIVTYITLVRMFEYYKLLGDTPDVVNYVLLPTVGHHVLLPNVGHEIGQQEPFKVIAPYSDFIDEECIILPYDVIRLNDGDQLTHIFTKLFGQLEVDKQEFIKYTLSNYHAKQNQLVLNNPIQYINDLKNKMTFKYEIFNNTGM
jgi:hypothetical protein